MKAPEILETSRLTLRRPVPADAEAIFETYASDREVTHFLGWPRHRSLADTTAFLEHSDREWERWPAGPYLIERPGGELIGGCGLGYQTESQALTGFVLARKAWGLGFATEVLKATIESARQLGLHRLQALCHVDHKASQHVFDKCSFHCDGILESHTVFPNLDPDTSLDVVLYTLDLRES